MYFQFLFFVYGSQDIPLLQSNPLTRNSNINLAHATLFLGIIQKPDIRGGVKSYKILYLFWKPQAS